MKRTIMALSLTLALAIPALAAEKTSSRGRTVFDLAHSEVFSPLKDGPVNYSSLFRLIKERGADTGVNESRITSKSLRHVKTYVIAGPMAPLGGEEIEALKAFVAGGGNLLVLLHISPPAAELTQNFGIIVSNFVISERTGIIMGRSQDFYVTRLSPHPVTEGVGKISLYGTWGLMATGGARTVAETSPEAWMDLNRNRTFEEGEPVQAYGIVAVAEHGKGKVVVVGDDAPFANQFLDEADNRKLAVNILDWFGGGRKK